MLVRSTRRTLGPRLPIAVSAAFLLLWLLLAAGPWQAQADTGPAMSLSLTGADVSCDAPPTACSVPVSGQFLVAIEVATAPGEGYVSFQTEVYYGQGLSYVPEVVADEIVWPASALPARTESLRLVAHGDTTGTAPPLPASDHTGSIVELAMQCPPIASPFSVALVTYDEAERPFGSGFALPDGAGGVGATVAAKAVGVRTLDIPGVTGPVAVSAAIDINCTHDAPTPTPTAPATATPTATSTPLTLPGDASCDGFVNAIDATLILQAVAALLETLPCPENGDASGDGVLTSVDAAFVLQFTAGLITL